MNIIYRKDTGQVVGYQNPPHSLDVEYQNVANSDVGTGNIGDYAHVEIEVIPDGLRPLKVETGVVEYESLTAESDLSVADTEAHAELKASAQAKLKALGLTDAEIATL